MDWSEIVDNPLLADLPFKIEQDRYGNIVMSPASNRHGYLQVEIAATLRSLMSQGRVVVECSVQTTAGVKVPDVVWQSAEHDRNHADTTPLPIAPEVCVEVFSPSNSEAEMNEKRELYFAAGAREVWYCRDNGDVEFYDATGRLNDSGIAPGFPRQIA